MDKITCSDFVNYDDYIDDKMSNININNNVKLQNYDDDKMIISITGQDEQTITTNIEKNEQIIECSTKKPYVKDKIRIYYKYNSIEIPEIEFHNYILNKNNTVKIF